MTAGDRPTGELPLHPSREAAIDLGIDGYAPAIVLESDDDRRCFLTYRRSPLLPLVVEFGPTQAGDVNRSDSLRVVDRGVTNSGDAYVTYQWPSSGQRSVPAPHQSTAAEPKPGSTVPDRTQPRPPSAAPSTTAPSTTGPFTAARPSTEPDRAVPARHGQPWRQRALLAVAAVSCLIGLGWIATNLLGDGNRNIAGDQAESELAEPGLENTDDPTTALGEGARPSPQGECRNPGTNQEWNNRVPQGWVDDRWLVTSRIELDCRWMRSIRLDGIATGFFDRFEALHNLADQRVVGVNESHLVVFDPTATDPRIDARLLLLPPWPTAPSLAGLGDNRIVFASDPEYEVQLWDPDSSTAPIPVAQMDAPINALLPVGQAGVVVVDTSGSGTFLELDEQGSILQQTLLPVRVRSVVHVDRNVDSNADQTDADSRVVAVQRDDGDLVLIDLDNPTEVIETGQSALDWEPFDANLFVTQPRSGEAPDGLVLIDPGALGGRAQVSLPEPIPSGSNTQGSNPHPITRAVLSEGRVAVGIPQQRGLPVGVAGAAPVTTAIAIFDRDDFDAPPKLLRLPMPITGLAAAGPDAIVVAHQHGLAIWDITDVGLSLTDAGPATLSSASDGSGQVVTGHADGSVQLWNLSDPRSNRQLIPGGPRPVSSLAFLADGRVAMSDSRSGIRVVDPAEAEPEILQWASPERVFRVMVAGRNVLAPISQGRLVRWNLDQAEPQGDIIEAPPGRVTTWFALGGDEIARVTRPVVSSPDPGVSVNNKVLARPDLSNRIDLFTITSGGLVSSERNLAVPNGQWPMNVASLPTGEFVASSRFGLTVWYPTGPSPRRFSDRLGLAVAITHLPTGRVAVANSSGQISIYDLRDGREQVIDIPSRLIGLETSGTGSLIVTTTHGLLEIVP